MVSLVLLLLIYLLVSEADKHVSEGDTGRKKKSIRKRGGGHGSIARWGSPFNTGSLEGSNVIRDCGLPQNGAKICCYALNTSTTYMQDVHSQAYERGLGFQKRNAADVTGVGEEDTSITRTGCVVSHVYHPSSFENVQMDLAYSIQNISSIPERYRALREAIIGEEMVLNSTIWTKKVQERMTTMSFSSDHSDVDKIYLSRFHMKATCDDGFTNEWDEYIEPLTINARHPFGYRQCPKGFWDEEKTKTEVVGMTNVDYVLLQSGVDLQRRRKYVNKKEQGYGRNFMLDAGINCSQILLILC